MAKKVNRAVTDAQIAAWKKQHGTISEIVVEQDGTEYSCVVRKPNIDDVLAAEEFAKDDSIKQANFLFKQCHLGGDEQFLTDDELRLSAGMEVSRMFRILKATAKKL
ncbi:MAG TPA: hypothetical protein PLP27_12030 [Crocinitomicaceae bacterium]|nr:hypothetical protein [Crocinitomicaceae bacterium]